MKKLLLIGLILITSVFQSKSQMQVFPNLYTPSQLVLDVLITGCLQASNVVYTGDLNAKGYFTYSGAVSGFPFVNGVILSSGSATGAAGPNNSGSSTTPNNGGPYPLLATVITGGNTNTNNASVLEFDFIPADDIINFRYVFGSDEYPEWVNSSFNDVFAFFLTGPNPLGPAYNNKNIAIVPGTLNTAVSINNVNIGMNNAYYVTNTQQVIQYDGYTVALTATANVVPCANYHIRLAISDVGDTAYDSGVFLEGGSMISGEVVAMTNYNPVGANNIIYEGCTNYYVFTRTDPTDVSTPILVLLNLSGTATPNVDITGFPTSLTIPVGQVSDTVFYSAIMDNITEGTEYIVFTLLNGCPCTVGSTRDTIWILENNTINAGIVNNDTLICSATPISVTLNSFTNTPAPITHYQWSSSAGIVPNPTSPSVIVTPQVGAATTYTLIITDDCGQIATDQVVITVSNMSTISINPTNLICNNVCQGVINVTPTSGFPPYTYNWTPANAGSLTTGIANNLCAGPYSVTVQDQFGCKSVGTTTLTQPPAVVLSFTTVPSTCPGANDGRINITITNGVPPFTLTCTTLPLPVTVNSNTYSFLNMFSGNYTINVVDATGCMGTGITNVGQLQLSFTTNTNDATCYNKNDGSASVNVTGGTQPYSYTWSFTSPNVYSVNGLYAGNYTVTVTDNHNCQIAVPIVINQPDSLIITNSEDTTMCKGETAILNVYATGGTPDYSYYWNNNLGSSVNSVSPNTTSIFSVYVMDDNGCRSAVSQIRVTIYPNITATAYTNQDSICIGDSVYISVNPGGGNGGPYTFYMEGIQVFPPVMVSPEETTTFTIVVRDDCGSPEGTASIKINIMNPPESQISIPNPTGCAPLTVQFYDASPNQGQTYLWYFGESDFGYSTIKNPIHTYNNSGFYDVWLITTSPFGCKNKTIINGLVHVLPSPVASFIPDPLTVSFIHPVIFFKNQSVGQTMNYWIFGDGTPQISQFGEEEGIQHIFSKSGRFYVSLVVENNEGCLDTLVKTVVVNEEFTFYVPNVISPQGTNPENAVFKSVGVGFDSNNFHLMIFDRWGSKIFETFDPERAWDGRINGGSIGKAGTYSWIIIYKDKNGLEHIEKGYVSIIY